MGNSKLWRGLFSLFACLTAVVIFMTTLCFKWQGQINIALGTLPPVSSSGTRYGTAYSKDGALSDASLKEMLKASDAHDVQTMEEGAVLVKNDNDTLPLSSTERKITLFGRAVADPVFRGNSGGTSRDPARLVSLYSALKTEGFKINDELFNAYKNSTTKRGKGLGKWTIGEETQSFYTDTLKATYANDYNDVALIMLSRDGGEGNDLPMDYNGTSFLALQQEEKDLLKMVENSGKFGKTIVLINSAYAMELDWVEQHEYGVDACLWIGGPGLVGFVGVANILVGKADPSGHFVDTYAANSLSAPATRNAGNFKYTNASDIKTPSASGYVVEAEGIYIGYKYYETRYQDQVLGINNANCAAGVYASSGGSWNYAEEMAYPFGYGTSYADCTQTLKSVVWDRTAHTVTATVSVVNNGVSEGSQYEGKSKFVVQLYVQLPYERGQAEKSAIQLIDFGKTKALAKGEEDTVTITVDDYIFATYDENATNGADASKKGCYVFDEGNYYFAIGENCHDALNNVLAAKGVDGMFDIFGNAVQGNAANVHMENMAELDNKTYAKSVETGEIVYNKLGHVNLNSYKPDSVTYLTRSDWNTYPKTYDDVEATVEMIKDLAGSVYKKAADAPSYSSTELGQDKGIDLADMIDVEFDDDAKWNEFLRQMTLAELCSIIGEAFGQPAIKTINKPANSNSDGPSGPQGSYAFGDKGSSSQHVNEVVAASTFNKQILKDRGWFIGEDCLYTGTTQLWGPGANIHRTPFSGRNFEYYSEDSIMSYLCGAEQVAAMQAKGVNTAIKHFCANDQETNREGLSVFMTEQSYRQGPLKGFEGAFTKGGALSTMMAMVRIGCKLVYADEATLIGVVRNEWGFKGVNITDSAAGQSCISTIECLMAGTDTFNADFGRGGTIQKQIVVAKDGALLARVLEVNKYFYYSMIRSNNSNMFEKPVTHYTPWWQPVTITICCVTGAAALACAVMYTLSLFAINKKKGGAE